jgi:DNA-binding MarR family transcriptional regulator
MIKKKVKTQKKKIENKFIRLAELSLTDFLTRSEDELLRFFTTTPQHWIMLHKVVIAYYKNETISKNQLLKFIERSYLTSNTYVDTAIKKDYFKIIRNNEDKRSIFILPTEETLKKFEKFIMQRENLYKL